MLGETVRHARQSKGLTQGELAERAGLSRNYVVALEKGANVTLDVVKRVARALGLQQVAVGEGIELIVPPGTASTVDVFSAREQALQIEKAVRTTASAVDRLRELLEEKPASVDDKEQQAETSEIDVIADLVGAPGSPFRVPQPLAVDDDEWITVTVEGRVAAGPPIDYAARETVRVPREHAPHPGWIVLEAWGDSMEEFGIHSGDLVYVEPRIGGVAATGEVVIGWLNEGLVIKEWEARRGRRRLISANASIPPRELTRDDVWELRAIVREAYPRRARALRFPNISGKQP
jgi:SOS-response transcriptional repressor LexA/DNA-binding Xre family transcriptional regulator